MPGADGRQNVLDGTIPYRLRVGVTGHRILPPGDAVAHVLEQALGRVRELAPPFAGTRVHLSVISSLAEGADRLVAAAVLADPDAQLEVVLPLAADDYRHDFATADSQREFDELLGRATRIVELPAAETREEAYEQAGRYVVERCDVLVALWDGEPVRGTGGTADIVDWARDRRVPLLWIHIGPIPALTEELGDGVEADPFADLDRYNRASLPRDRFSGNADQYIAGIVQQATDSGMDPSLLAPFAEWLAPYYVRADLLASRSQRRFFLFSDAIFVLAALAVVASAGAEIGHRIPALVETRIFSHLRPLPLIESTAMLLVLIVLYLVRRRAFHRGWIYHRMLAERLRSSLFLAMARLDAPGGRETEHVSLRQPSEGWLDRAFEEVWSQRPPVDSSLEVDRLRKFLADAWIGDQARYQQRKSHRHEWNNKAISNATVAIFFVTLLLAGLNATSVITTEDLNAPVWMTFALYLSITLPAVGSALGGIGAQREHRRNAHRSGRMARYLGTLEARMRTAVDLPTIHAIARQASEVMVEDVDDWFVTMEFRDVELQG